MKLLPRLVILFIVCLIAIAVPAAPAQAECVPYDIELSTESGIPGTEVTVYGHDFQDDALVDLYYDGDIVVQDVRTNSGGRSDATRGAVNMTASLFEAGILNSDRAASAAKACREWDPGQRRGWNPDATRACA